MYLIQISCIICFCRAHFRLQEKADLQVRHQNCKKHKEYGAPSSFHTSVWHMGLCTFHYCRQFDRSRLLLRSHMNSAVQLRKLRAAEREVGFTLLHFV
jgi:hypothetical protein